MDDARFEALARAVASRRSLSAGLFAAAAAVAAGLPLGRSRRSAAQEGCAFEGESCAGVGCCEGLACSAEFICYNPFAEDVCAGAGESCSKSACCAGLFCGDGQICYGTDGGGEVACAGPGESCVELGCCGGLGCSEGICVAVESGETGPTCAFAGESCAVLECCDGLGCSEDVICVPVNGGQATPVCAFAGESCASLTCCEGLACGDGQICVTVPTCAFENEYCAFLECCDGLTCGPDDLCIPGGGARRDRDSDEPGGDSEDSIDGTSAQPRATRAPRTPRPVQTPETGVREITQDSDATPAAQARRRPNLPPVEGETLFTATLQPGDVPDADAYALLAQAVTIDPGMSVSMAAETVDGFDGLAIDLVLEGEERIRSVGELRVVRRGAEGTAELVDPETDVILAPGDAAIRRLGESWTTANPGSGPLRLLHVTLSEDGPPPAPQSWERDDYQFALPVPEGDLGAMEIEIDMVTLEPDTALPPAANDEHQAAVLSPAGGRGPVRPLVPMPDGSSRNASAQASTIYRVTARPADR
jgi:hypothetical protein